MDIKSKKYNGGLYYSGFILFVISTLIAIGVGSWIVLSYYTVDWDGASEPVIVAMRDSISTLWMYVIGASAIGLVSLVGLMVLAGRKEIKEKLNINWFDKIFAEVQLVIMTLAVLGVCGLTYMWTNFSAGTLWFTRHAFAQGKITLEADSVVGLKERLGYYSDTPFSPAWVEVVFIVVAMALLVALTLALLLSLVKKIKLRRFWKNTLCGVIVMFFVKSYKNADSIFWKTVLILVAGCLLSATVVGSLLVLALIIIFVPRILKEYQSIVDGVEEVKSGNLNYKIPITNEDGELGKLAKGINEISNASSVAVQNELKNQRMKTDLISNVSHDLKTPLTSMVSYIDLLKTEGLESENGPEYLNIIDEKTKRLQKLTEDLFEAAKASSGAIPVNLEKIEMTSIVNQALVEMEDQLAENKLKIVFDEGMEKKYVNADGQLLWRVIENLLVNASKYALAGSRVYIDITDKGENTVLLEVKNISKDPLNISADELMERFKRGDEARNTEGSGLGLAIAKDLVRLMNGWFEISIDGDLFKASVSLKKDSM